MDRFPNIVNKETASIIRGFQRVVAAFSVHAVWLLVLLSFACFKAPLAHAATRTVTVGVYENAPKIFTSESGAPSGIFVDIIEYVAKNEGWSLRYVSGTWAEGLDRLAKGEIDLMPDVAYTAEREKIFSFHKVPVLTVWSQVYANRGSGIQSILDLNGKKIGALEQTIQLETFRRLTNSFGLKITLVPMPDYKTEFEMVAAGKVDAGVTNRFYGLMYARKFGLEDTPIMFDPAPFFFAAPRKASGELLDTIDRHLSDLKKDHQSAYYASMRRWTSEEVHFTVPAWLRAAGIGLTLLTVLILSLVIRKQRAAESALRKEKVFAETIIDSVPGAFYVIDAGGRLVRWNRYLAKLNDFSAGELRGMDSLRNIHDEDRDVIAGSIKNAFKTGEAEAEARIKTTEGERTFLFTGRRVDVGGQPLVVGSGIEITSRKHAEQKAARISTLYSVLSKINEAIVRMRDTATLFEQVCTIAVREGRLRMVWIGMTDPDTLLVKPVAIAGHDEGYLQGARFSVDEKTPEGRGPTGTAVRQGGYFVCNDIEHDPLLAGWRDAALKRGYRSSAAFPLTVHGRVVGTINLYADKPFFFEKEEEIPLLSALAADVSFAIESIDEVNERRRAQQELLGYKEHLEELVKERTVTLQETNTRLQREIEERSRAQKELRTALEDLAVEKERAEAADRLKSAFLATMSHELRTPLNSIIGFSGILRQGLAGPLNDEQKKQMEMVQNSADHLLALINDVLDISKIEAGQLQVAAAPFDLSASVLKVVRAVRPLAEKKGLLLTTGIGEGVGVITSDQRRVEQVLLNLLSNAIKYTEKGQVSVACALQGDAVLTTIADTGIGIAKDDLLQLFKPFHQVESGLTRRYEGTGLGLSICKKLVELLRGTIHVESELGGGSRFSFTLPAQRGAA